MGIKVQNVKSLLENFYFRASVYFVTCQALCKRQLMIVF